MPKKKLQLARIQLKKIYSQRAWLGGPVVTYRQSHAPGRSGGLDRTVRDGNRLISWRNFAISFEKKTPLLEYSPCLNLSLSCGHERPSWKVWGGQDLHRDDLEGGRSTVRVYPWQGGRPRAQQDLGAGNGSMRPQRGLGWSGVLEWSRSALHTTADAFRYHLK